MRAAARQPTEAPLVSGEFPLTSEDFSRIAAVLREDSGIHLPDGKAALVYSRLAKRLRLLGLESFDAYCALIASADGLEERRSMLTALTTNVTRFFREPHHFDHLKQQIVSRLAAKARAGGKVRFWSAGCSTGEEPYSIALTVLSALPEAADLDVRILATDIDTKVIAKAKRGVYDAEAVGQIPAALRGRVKPHGDDGEYAIDESVKRLITFNELNLMGPWPMKGRFDAIFCRNVAIYFDEPTQERLWGRFADHLDPAGNLHVGHSERVADRRFQSDGLTSYRLGGAR